MKTHALVCAALALFAAVPESLAEPEVRSLQTEGQRRFFALPRAEREKVFVDADYRSRMAREVGGLPAGVTLSWSGGTAPYRVALKVGERTAGEIRTDGTSAAVDNLEIARTYVWTATDAKGRQVGGGTFVTADEAPRFLRVGGMRNVRDIGGRVGRDGRRVRQGLVFRSEGLNYNAQMHVVTNGAGVVSTNRVKGARRLTEEGVSCWLTELKVRTDLDLRTDREVWGMDGSPLGPLVRWIRISSDNYDGIRSPRGRSAFVRDFRVFLDEANYPIVFHCIAGADRTGSLACILNGLLGVGEEELVHDWEATAFSTSELRFRHATRWDRLIEVFDAYPGKTLAERIEAYVLDCGITRDEIRRFRELMLEEKPE